LLPRKHQYRCSRPDSAAALRFVAWRPPTANGREKHPGLKEPHGEEALVEPPLKLVTESGAP